MVLQRWAQTNRLYCSSCTVIIEIVHTRDVFVQSIREGVMSSKI